MTLIGYNEFLAHGIISGAQGRAMGQGPPSEEVQLHFHMYFVHDFLGQILKSGPIPVKHLTRR